MPIRISLLNYNGEWIDQLDCIPSECWRRFKHGDDAYHLYLRWRHSDPWQGYVVREAMLQPDCKLDANNQPMFCPDDDWSADLFEPAGQFFTEEDVEAAKLELEKLAHKFLMAPIWEAL